MSAAAPEQLWWSAAELAGAGLPDLPGTRQGVELLAKRQGWRGDPERARRREGRGGGWEYHWRLLPAAAQAALVKGASSPHDEVAPASAANETLRPDREEVWGWFEGLPEGVQRQAAARLQAIQQVEALEPVLGKYMAV